MVETVIATPAGPLLVCCVHLDHVSAATRMPQVEMMMDLALNARQRGGNWGWLQSVDAFTDAAPPMPDDVVIMGDMNFTSAEYSRVIGDISQWHGRTVRAVGLADAWTIAGHDEQAGDTIPHADPAIGPRRIDHCFIAARLAAFVTTMTIGTTAQGSACFMRDSCDQSRAVGLSERPSPIQ